MRSLQWYKRGAAYVFEVFVLLGLVVLGLFVRSCTKCEDSLTRKNNRPVEDFFCHDVSFCAWSGQNIATARAIFCSPEIKN
jgi:hypothetical protein